jgi:hypothetical protein
MVEHLRVRWRDDLSLEALVGLRDELDDMLGRIRSTRHITNPVFKCPACGRIGRGANPPSAFAPRYWRWLASAWSRENKHGSLRRHGLPTERRRNWISMATLRRQNPLDSQGARTPMNSERRTDLIQGDHPNGSLRVTMISRSPGRREPSPLGDFGDLSRRRCREPSIAPIHRELSVIK